MKVFISYHRGDTKYKNKLVDYLKSIGVSHYVVPENYVFDGKYHQDIANIIIQNMKSCDVTVCIIGEETYSRPHVDHELKATLKGGVCERKGLVGLMLENRGDNKNNIDWNTFPNRIQDNYTDAIPYVQIGQWASFKDELADLLIEANDERCANYNVKNNRKCMQLRQKKYYDN